MKNMLAKYNDNQWYQIDILIDWNNPNNNGKSYLYKKQRVDIFIDGKQVGSDTFFSNEPYGSEANHKIRIPSANSIIIYGLSPDSTSKVRDLEICLHKCDGSQHLIYSGANLRFRIEALILILNIGLIFL